MRIQKATTRRLLKHSKWLAAVIYLLAIALMFLSYPAPIHWLWIAVGGLAGGWFALILHRQWHGKI